MLEGIPKTVLKPFFDALIVCQFPIHYLTKAEISMVDSSLVSIVLPVHNGSRYLRESIESVLGQTYSNLELIVVDDASTDRTPQILKEYSERDSRIRVVKNPENLKLPKSLNRGFAEAKGVLLSWTSDDNRYDKQAIQRMVDFLTANPSVDLVYTDYQLIDSEGHEAQRVTVEDPVRLWAGNTVGCCFLYRRPVYERLGGYAEDLFLAEDYDFWLRTSRYFKLTPLHETLYQYRYHGSSLTSLGDSRTAPVADEALARNLGLMDWLPREARIEGALRLVKGGLKRGDWGLSARFWFFALKQSPLKATTTLFKKLFRGFNF